MNRRLALRGLWWKELQQMWPLAVILLAIGALLEAVYTISTTVTGQPMHNGLVLLGLPGLFAVGVGALLVGQEKEQRTIQWLTSLPIAARDIVRTKMLVGIVGLVVVWLATLILTYSLGTTPSTFIAAPDISPTQGMIWWLIHTFAVLFIGFATSWKLRSSFVGLLILLPLACLPYLLTSIHVAVWETYAWGEVILAYSLIFAIAFWWIGWQAGLQSLGPQAARRGNSSSASSRDRIIYSAARGRVGPLPAMVWQFVAQNRMALSGLIFLFGFSTVGLSLTGTNGFGPSSFLFSLGVFLSSSWLGLLVFQSDSQHQRVMFLADRGVSPWMVWCTRQVAPMSLLICGAVLLILLVPRYFSGGWITIAVAFAIFLSAQWISQLVRSPIIGIVIAPVIGVAAIGSAGFASVELFSPSWTLVLAGGMAILATFLLTSKWMDGRTDWRFFLGHGIFLVLAISTPIMPFIYFTANYPRLSGDARHKLEAILEKSPDHRSTSEFITLLPTARPIGNESASDDAPTNATSLSAWRDSQLQHLKQQLAANPDAMLEHFAVRALSQDILLLRMQLSQQRSPKRIEQYSDAVFVLTEFVRRYRSSGLLSHQDRADVMEVWLLEELKQPDARDLLNEDVYGRALALLKDSELRDAARRKAVAVSWKHASEGQLGGYSVAVNTDRKSVTPREVFIAGRNAGVISELLLKLLDASENERPQIRSRIHELLGRSNNGMDERYFYISDATGKKQLLYGELENDRTVAFLWRESWEAEAAAL